MYLHFLALPLRAACSLAFRCWCPAASKLGRFPLGSVIVLIDAAELLVAEDPGDSIDASGETTVQMNTAPDSPIVASTSFLSLWQMGLVGVKIVRHINWQLRRPGAVAVLSGINY